MAKREGEKRRASLNSKLKNAVDATCLLKRLTPKLKRSARELNVRQDGEEETTQPGKSADEPTSTCSDQAPSPGPALEPTAEDVPEWYEELSEDHVSAFKEVFDMLDTSKTGSLNADNLYEGLRRVDSEITFGEVENVLNILDKDGNGEVDFEEFLFHISHGAMDGDDNKDGDTSRKRRAAFTKRQRLFYSAITEFSLKRTLADIQRAQMARVNQPHVLRHYTAGARLIGLTDRQLAIEMKKMHKTMKQRDSPYSQPLQLVVSEGGQKTVRKAIRPRRKAGDRAAKGDVAKAGSGQMSNKMSQMKQMPVQAPGVVPSDGSIRVKIPDIRAITGTPKLSTLVGIATQVHAVAPSEESANKQFREAVRMITSRRSDFFSKLPDAHKILELREKLANDLVAVAEETTSAPVPQVPSPATPPTTPDKPKKARFKRRRIVTGWTTPRVDRDKVPLPVLKIKYKHHRPTIEDLPNIREKVSQAIDDYYENLRKATVKNAWDQWDNLYSHCIRSAKIMENFREVYRAYSPHKEEEAFVVCPWVPGPFRTIKFSSRCRTAGYYKPQCLDRPRPSSRQHVPRSSRTAHEHTSGRTSRSENRPFSAMQ